MLSSRELMVLKDIELMISVNLYQTAALVQTRDILDFIRCLTAEESNDVAPKVVLRVSCQSLAITIQGPCLAIWGEPLTPHGDRADLQQGPTGTTAVRQPKVRIYLGEAV